MNERFSKIGNEKMRNRRTNGAIFACIGVFLFPLVGTAIAKSETAANHSTLLSNAGFIFSVFLIPLVFFGIYKLDRLVERKIPKRGREREFTSGETKVLQ